MKQKRFEMRVEDWELKEWQAKADRESLPLAGWIRQRCNQEGEEVAAAPVTEKRAKRKSEFAEQVAGRTGHEIGCECFQCAQTEGFIRSQRSK